MMEQILYVCFLNCYLCAYVAMIAYLQEINVVCMMPADYNSNFFCFLPSPFHLCSLFLLEFCDSHSSSV